MDRDRYQRAKSIFLELCLLDAAPRGERLGSLRAEDAELYHEVRQLLSLDTGGEDEPTIGISSPAPHPPPPDIPQQLGEYRLLHVIGEGGMGIVYAAQQSTPHRRVALKVLRHSLSESARRRFAFEAEILGKLEHPAIAKIYSAHLPDDDAATPYLAMELVEGVPLHVHLERCRGDDRRRLAAKLSLFERICDGVQHAHQRGIIHRDLKPANILVTEQGDPRILDFGIARALPDQELGSLASMQTHEGQLMGTLAYMSPEQINGDTVDVRTDVHALGVMLFEILTDQLPYAVSRTRLGDLLDNLARGEPRRLGQTDSRWRGDLDVIVSKALERDPERRYSSAANFAADIRRYLDNEPILARRATLFYSARKFARRHRAIVAAVSAVAITLVVAATLVVRSLDEAIEANDLAADRLKDAERARDLASARFSEAEASRQLAQERLEETESAWKIAEQQATTTELINSYILDEVLGAGDFVARLDPDLKVSDALFRAANSFEPGVFEDPLVEARVASLLARGFMSLGYFDEAEKHLRVSMTNLEQVFSEHHQLADPTELQKAHLAMALLRLRQERLQESLHHTRLMFPQVPTATSEGFVCHYFIMLSNIHLRLADYDAARRNAQRGLEWCDSNPEVGNAKFRATCFSVIAESYSRNREYDTAVEWRQRALELDDLDPYGRIDIRLDLVRNATNARSYDLALATLEAARPDIDKLPPFHGYVWDHTRLHARVLRFQDKIEEALAIVEPAYDLFREAQGELFEGTRALALELGYVYSRLDRAEDAERTWYRLLELDPDRQWDRTRQARTALLQHLRRLDRHRDSIPLLQEELSYQETFQGWDSPQTQATLRDLAEACYETEDFGRSLELNNKLLNLRTASLGIHHEHTLTTLTNTAWCLYKLRRFDEAEVLRRKVLAGRRSNPEVSQRKVLKSVEDLAAVLFAQKKNHAERATLRGEAWQLRRSLDGADQLKTIDAQRKYARGLLEAGNPTDALPIALDAYHLALGRKGKDFALTRRCAESVARIYEALGDLSKANEWDLESKRHNAITP